MDATTEVIAHFIGHFAQLAEMERLRTVYEAISREESGDPELGDLAAHPLILEPDYRIPNYAPDLGQAREMATDLQLAAIPGKAPFVGELPVAARAASPYVQGGEGFVPALPVTYADAVDVHVHEVHFVHGLLTPPNSIVGVTVQQAILTDTDILHIDPSMPLPNMAFQQADLDAAVALAEGLTAFEIDWQQMAGGVDIDAAQALAETVAGAEAVEGTLLLLRGGDASGIFVNGGAAEMPVLSDLLPDPFREDDDAGEESVEEADHDPLNETSGVAEATALDPGHILTTGGNLTSNEVVLNLSPVDAGVISVAGDYLKLDAITQAVFVSDRDTGTPGGEATEVVNAAELRVESGTDVGPTISGWVPQNWHVTHIDGDLQFLNIVQQNIYTFDGDLGQVSITAAATEITMGGNTVVNSAILQEFSYGFDLIFVGGDMIDITAISQLSVLLDNDAVGHDGTAPGSVSGDGNLVFNYASVVTHGTDELAPMTDSFARTGEALAHGGAIGHDLRGDALFDGLDSVRVLEIEGDFISVNLIEQINVLGDSDAVSLAFEEDLATAEAATVTTGSNAVVNAATVATAGVDSTIMVGGDSYTDALIHQAELVDYGAAEPDPTALASEAVVFLAADMIDGDGGQGPMAPGFIGHDDLPGQMDVMQGMTA